MQREEPDGIAMLRSKRGDEEVTFADVADHLHDFTHRHPEDRPTVEALARFLASVEGQPHHHDGHTRTEAAAR